MTSLAATPAPHRRTHRFVRSLGEFGSMAGSAYRTGVAYRCAREAHGRHRVLNSFVAELQHRA
jgi:DNA-binding transcriptional regulator LsrR (DeoR family)